MQKDILEKAGEIIKKDQGIFLETLTNKEKTILMMPSVQNISYPNYFQSLIFPKVVTVIIRSDLLCPINIKMYGSKLLLYLKKTNVGTDIVEYMQHLKTSESFYRKRLFGGLCKKKPLCRRR